MPDFYIKTKILSYKKAFSTLKLHNPNSKTFKKFTSTLFIKNSYILSSINESLSKCFQEREMLKLQQGFPNHNEKKDVQKMQ